MTGASYEHSPSRQLTDLQATLGNVMSVAGRVYPDNTADLAVQPIGEGFPDSPGMKGNYSVARYTYMDSVGDPAIEVAVGQPAYDDDDPLALQEPYRVGLKVTNENGESFVYRATIPTGSHAHEASRLPSDDERSPAKGRLIITHARDGVMLPQRVVRLLSEDMPNVTAAQADGLLALSKIVGKARQSDFLDDTHTLDDDDLANLTRFLAATYGTHDYTKGANPLSKATGSTVPDAVPAWMTAGAQPPPGNTAAEHTSPKSSTGKIYGTAAVHGAAPQAAPRPAASWPSIMREVLDRHGYQPGPAPDLFPERHESRGQGHPAVAHPQGVLKGALRYLRSLVSGRRQR
jgi:hypothetical protein